MTSHGSAARREYCVGAWPELRRGDERTGGARVRSIKSCFQPLFRSAAAAAGSAIATTATRTRPPGGRASPDSPPAASPPPNRRGCGARCRAPGSIRPGRTENHDVTRAGILASDSPRHFPCVRARFAILGASRLARPLAFPMPMRIMLSSRIVAPVAGSALRRGAGAAAAGRDGRADGRRPRGAGRPPPRPGCWWSAAAAARRLADGRYGRARAPVGARRPGGGRAWQGLLHPRRLRLLCSGTLVRSDRLRGADRRDCVTNGRGQWAAGWTFGPAYSAARSYGQQPRGGSSSRRAGPGRPGAPYDVAFVRLRPAAGDGRRAARRAGRAADPLRRHPDGVGRLAYVFGYPALRRTRAVRDHGAGPAASSAVRPGTRAPVRDGRRRQRRAWLAGFSPRRVRHGHRGHRLQLSGDLRMLYGTVLGPSARGLYLKASA